MHSYEVHDIPLGSSGQTILQKEEKIAGNEYGYSSLAYSKIQHKRGKRARTRKAVVRRRLLLSSSTFLNLNFGLG